MSASASGRDRGSIAGRIKRVSRLEPFHYQPPCITCKDRKVKCDQTFPVCGNCRKKGRSCPRPSRFTWAIHGVGGHGGSRTSPDLSENTALLDSTKRIVVPRKLFWVQENVDALYDHLWDARGAVDVSRSPSRQEPGPFRLDKVDKGNISALALYLDDEPLQHVEIVKLFLYYIEVLAPWYDLNDPSCVFSILVSEKALRNPILLKAVIAFAASHKAKFDSDFRAPAEQCHASCIDDLIPLLQESICPDLQGELLAATCLLRSYEILNGDTRNNQSHLFGAYTFASQSIIDLNGWGLVQAGFWNYLREDITVALECGRPLHMPLDGPVPTMTSDSFSKAMMEASWSNAITFLLGRAINTCFGKQHPRDVNVMLSQDYTLFDLRRLIDHWKDSLPEGFRPISIATKPDSVFPSTWMMRPWHTAGLHYYHTIEILLAQETAPTSTRPSVRDRRAIEATAENHALQICGLTSVNTSAAVRVNAFGPMAYCGRFLVDTTHRHALVELLETCAAQVGWNVTRMLSDLREHWREQ